MADDPKPPKKSSRTPSAIPATTRTRRRVAMQGKDIAVPAVFVVRADESIAWKTVGENVTDRPKAADVLLHARSAK